MMKYILASIFMLTSLGIVAQSAQAHPVARVLHACAVDYDRYCYKVTPGGGRILACLVRNRSRLKPRCRSALREVQRNLNSFYRTPLHHKH